MSLTKIIALIFLTLIFATSIAVASTTWYEDNWRTDIAINYGTNDCVDENTYYKMLKANFTDEELDWARNNIGYCAPRCPFIVSTEIQFVNENINFTAITSGGGGNHTIVSYKWDFGDGTTETRGDRLTTHKYSSEGNYTVKFTATNDQGHSCSDTKLLEIINDVNVKYVTQDDLQYRYGDNWNFNKYKKGDFVIRGTGQEELGKPQVGEFTIIQGKEYVHLSKYTGDGSTKKMWDIPVSNDPIFVHIYKNDLEVFYDVVHTNSDGEFTCYFIPEEAGYHKLVVEYPGPYMDYCMSYDSPNWDYTRGEYWYEQIFYVSEKVEEPQSPGFEAIFIITALLTVAYILRKKK